MGDLYFELFVMADGFFGDIAIDTVHICCKLWLVFANSSISFAVVTLNTMVLFVADNRKMAIRS